MYREPSSRLTGQAGVLRKAAVATAVGGLTMLLSNAAQQNLVYGLLMSVLIGGIALLIQFLMDFEARLVDLELSQRQSLAEARDALERGFSDVNEATELYGLLRSGPFAAEATQLIRNCGQLDASAPRLVHQIARHEIARVSGFLRDLSLGSEIMYDGEDREWLLALTGNTEESIDATSLATVDAGPGGFDTGMWKSDLGARYLDMQQAAIARRGVVVRRIFVVDDPSYLQDPRLAMVLQLQHEAGIQVKVLDAGRKPWLRLISDFIIFDRRLSYEIYLPSDFQPKGTQSQRLRTLLKLRPERLEELADIFERLWREAESVPWPRARD